jgi:hypothetical protein
LANGEDDNGEEGPGVEEEKEQPAIFVTIVELAGQGLNRIL